jgi:hypothetical protein
VQISRKASTVYYPTLHLELARYIDYAIRAGYELPYTVARLIGLPPPPHAKEIRPQPKVEVLLGTNLAHRRGVALWKCPFPAFASEGRAVEI